MHIGDMLLQSGIVTKEQLDEALAYQKSIGGHLGHIMVKLGFVTEDRLIQTLSNQLQIPTYDLDGFVPDDDVMAALPEEVLLRLNVVPIRKELGTLVVGVSDPADFSAIDELRMNYGGNVETLLVAPSKARDCLNRYFRHEDKTAGKPSSRQSRRGRERLNDLVHELERESASSDADAPAQGLENLTTRQIVLALVQTLQAKGVLTADEIEKRARDSASADTNDKTA